MTRLATLGVMQEEITCLYKADCAWCQAVMKVNPLMSIIVPDCAHRLSVLTSSADEDVLSPAYLPN